MANTFDALMAEVNQKISQAMTATSEANAAAAQANAAAQSATEQAQQIIANAQDHASRLIAKAQADAAQMVADDTITQTAKKYAEDIQAAAQAECDRLNDETLGNLHRMLEHADISLASQLEALRTLRHQLGLGYEENAMPEYDEGGYPEDGYSE